MIEISAKTNDHFKRWQDLNSSRGIRKHQEFFLMGEKLIREFLKNPTHKIKAEVIMEGMTAITPSHPAAAKFTRVPLFKLAKPLFNEIDFVGTHFNLLVLEPKEIASIDASEKPRGLEVVCPLGDPSNLGALARSAMAFGAQKFILTEESANPYLPKAIKASAGSLLQIPLVKVGKLEDVVPQMDGLHALDMHGKDIAQFAWPKDVRLLVGEEGPGIQRLPILHRIKIATGPVESLNATVAASIALYSYSQSK